MTIVTSTNLSIAPLLASSQVFFNLFIWLHLWLQGDNAKYRILVNIDYVLAVSAQLKNAEKQQLLENDKLIPRGNVGRLTTGKTV